MVLLAWGQMLDGEGAADDLEEVEDVGAEEAVVVGSVDVGADDGGGDETAAGLVGAVVGAEKSLAVIVPASPAQPS